MLRKKIRQLAKENGSFGSPRITLLLRREGSIINAKRVHRIWKTEGLQLPRKQIKKRWKGPKGEVIHKAEHINHVWSYDIIEDRTENGNKLRILGILDEFTRECLHLEVGRSISAATVLNALEWLALTRGMPGHLRSDNGPESIAKSVRDWLEQKHCSRIHITPGSPWENSYIESFFGKFRAECLNRYLFRNGFEAQKIVESWRWEDNTYRPHTSLEGLTLAEFANLNMLPKEVPIEIQCQNEMRILSL
jgi:putative transposase